MDKLIRITTVPQSLKGMSNGQLNFLKNYFEVVGISSSGEDLDYVEKEEKINVIPVEIKRNISPLNDLKSLIRLYKEIKKQRPLIVHTMTPKAGLLGMVASKMARVPIRMHTFTGLIFPSRKGILQRILILMDRILCLCATNIYPEGEGVKKDLIKFKITKKPLKVIANGNVKGIDISYYNENEINDSEKQLLKEELNISKNDFVYIFVGRLVRDKGIHELIEAFIYVNSIYPHTKLLLLGGFEPNLDPVSKNVEDEIINNPNIINAGFVKNVRLYYAISDVLVFPSYREGFPNTVLEAGAMGLPSIVTDINGCNEIILEGVNGLIILSKNVEMLKDSMELVLKDKSLYFNLKKNARELIVKRYEQKFVWECLLKEYQTLKNNFCNV